MQLDCESAPCVCVKKAAAMRNQECYLLNVFLSLLAPGPAIDSLILANKSDKELLIDLRKPAIYQAPLLSNRWTTPVRE